MTRIRIEGGHKLNGTIPISGAKNAALPLIIAALLTEKPLELRKVPDLADVRLLVKILTHLGADVTLKGRESEHEEVSGQVMRIDAARLVDTHAPYELVSQMRASFWVLAPLVARCGRARVSLPGGCAIGTRPVDLHLQALAAMGAEIDIEGGDVVARAPRGLRGARIAFPVVSVGATHAALLGAVLARGETVLENAAREPEIVDLARCLVAMGASIGGAGTSRIVVEGVGALSGASHEVLPDRIEAGTYAIATAMAGGKVHLEGARSDLLPYALEVMRLAGVDVRETNDGITVAREGELQPIEVVTEPFPGFPTDLQAQMMALATRAEGVSRITETIFENRFMHVGELARMGADISLSGRTAVVNGVDRLHGASVTATDLRASASLVIAALAAEGTTEIGRIHHLDRGFDGLEGKLAACGASIERVAD